MSSSILSGTPIDYITGGDDLTRLIFLFFLTLWVSIFSYYYLKYGSGALFNSDGVSLFQNVSYIILGTISLASGPGAVYAIMDDEAILMESVSVLFVLAYFLMDLVDTSIQGSIPFGVHAAVSTIIFIGCITSPNHLDNRSGSRGCYVELSTPFLHRWQRTKKKSDFRIFFVIFTICRIVYMPHFLCAMYDKIGMDYILASAMILYSLQVFWWLKMISILRNYKVDPRPTANKTTTKEEEEEAATNEDDDAKKQD